MGKSSQMTHDVAIIAASKIPGTENIRVVFEVEGERREDVFVRPEQEGSDIKCLESESGMLDFLQLHNIGLIKPLLETLRQAWAGKPVALPIVSRKIS